MTNDENYRWFILILVGLTATLVMAMPSMAIPVLFSEISADLGLNLIQVGAVWGSVSLAGLLTGLLGGVVGDRFGTKWTLTAGCLAMGLTGALRGFSNSFAALAASMLLTGLIGSMIPMNLHKACGIWFSGKRLGLANGVVAAGMALGFMSGSMISASVLSPWLSGWRGVLFFYGGIGVVMSIPWALSRPAPGDGNPQSGGDGIGSIRSSLLQIIRLKNVWLLGTALLGVGGCVQGLLGYLPLYLREIGWEPVHADAALASFHAVSLSCVFPLAYLSDRLGARKILLMAAAVMVALGVGLLGIAEGALIWVGVFMAGSVRDGFMAIFMTATTEQQGVGTAYAGTAIGLAMSLSGVGGLIAPPLGNSLANYNLRYPFMLWAAMALFGLVMLLQVKEKKKES
jgi:MFS family permease